jgi:hypothetical protein
MRRLLLTAVTALLAGCVAHTWRPGPDARTTDFDEAKARCDLVAHGQPSGFYAQGNPNFVAGAAVGAAVGDAIRTQNTFNDCMLATGWKIADPPPPAATNPRLITSTYQQERGYDPPAPNPSLAASPQPYYPPATTQPASAKIVTASNTPMPVPAVATVPDAMILRTPDGHAQLSLPAGYVQKPTPPNISTPQSAAMACTVNGDVCVGIFAIPKTDYVDLAAVENATMTSQFRTMKDAKVIASRSVFFGQTAGLQYELTGATPAGARFQFSETFMPSKEYYLKLAAFTLVSQFEAHRGEINELMTTLRSPG